MRRKFLILSAFAGLAVSLPAWSSRNGYVARLRLSETPTNSAKDRPAEAIADNGIARWHAGTPGSDQFFSGGSLVESLTTNGITVQVSLQETDWKLRANVAIANNSTESAHFNPAAFTLDELTPHLRSLAHQNPRDLAKVKTHQVYWTKVSAVAPAAPVNETSAYKNAAFVQSIPNYMAQDIAQTQASVLYAKTLAPNEKTSGVVWFERDKNPQQLTLRIFVDDGIFEFPLSFPPHN